MATLALSWPAGGATRTSTLTVARSRTTLPEEAEVVGYHRGELAGVCVAELLASPDAAPLVTTLYQGASGVPSPPQAAVLRGWAPGWLLVAAPDATALWLLAPPGDAAAAHTHTHSLTPAPVPAAVPAPAPAPSLSVLAAITAADDSKSKAYIGSDIPADKREKRNYLFSDLTPEVCDQLHIDEVALYSVSPAWMADKIGALILDLVGPQAVITDGTACVGGDTLRFARKFSRINSVEISKQRADMLWNNVKVTGCKDKVYVYHEDFVRICGGLVQDVVFMDPPWGGTDYKSEAALDMYLGPTPLIDVCAKIATRCARTRYIVLKLPSNFNQAGFERALPGKIPGASVRAHDVRKALLLVLSLPQPDGPPPAKRAK